MNQVQNLKKLQNLSYFDKRTLAQVIELSDNSLSANIKRWLGNGVLVQLKKGLYVTRAYVASQHNRRAYTEFLANKLREPSYVSMEYVLQHYSMLSEAVYGVTSVTMKTKRVYRNAFGTFVYRNIKAELFDGFTIMPVEGWSVKIATKAKALFDFLYYKLLRITIVDCALVESFRLNYEGLSNHEFDEFAAYCVRTRVRKMQQLVTIIRSLR